MHYLSVFRVTIESLEKIDEAGRWGRRGCLLFTESQLHRRWRFLCGFITIVGAYSWLYMMTWMFWGGITCSSVLA